MKQRIEIIYKMERIPNEVIENILSGYLMNKDKYNLMLLNSSFNSLNLRYDISENYFEPISRACKYKDFVNLKIMLSSLRSDWETLKILNKILRECILTENYECFKYFREVSWFKLMRDKIHGLYKHSIETIKEFHNVFPECIAFTTSDCLKDTIESLQLDKMEYTMSVIKDRTYIYQNEIESEVSDCTFSIIDMSKIREGTPGYDGETKLSIMAYSDSKYLHNFKGEIIPINAINILLASGTMKEKKFILDYFMNHIPSDYVTDILFRCLGQIEQMEFLSTFYKRNVCNLDFLSQIVTNKLVFNSSKALDFILRSLPHFRGDKYEFSTSFMRSLHYYMDTKCTYHEFYHKDDPLDVKLKISYTLRMFKKAMMIYRYIIYNFNYNIYHEFIITDHLVNLDSAYTILFNEV